MLQIGVLRHGRLNLINTLNNVRTLSLGTCLRPTRNGDRQHLLFLQHPLICCVGKTSQRLSIKYRNLHSTSRCFQTPKEEGNKNQNNGRNLIFVGFLVSYLSFVLFRVLFARDGSDQSAEQPGVALASNVIHISWQDFVDDILPTGEVKQIRVISDHSVLAILHPNAKHKGKPVRYVKIENLKDTSNFEDLLWKEEKKLGINPVDGIPVKMREFVSLTTLIELILILAIIAGIIIGTRSAKKTLNSMSETFKQVLAPVSKVVKKTNVTFKDVAGMKEAKQEVMEFVDFLKKPSFYESLGAKMPRGCLLTGPPGVGKTLLAKAVATEADVPFIAKAGSDFVELIGGLGARRMRELFKEARGMSPCIIYIDEIDAVGAARDKHQRFGGSGEKDQTLNQLLVEMDGMLSKEHQVIILASTNRSDMLDKALLRPGRFDRVIQIELPNRNEREEILLRYLNDLKLSDKPPSYAPKLAAVTTGMSGADLANVCNEAAIYAAREGDKVITNKHLDYAVERVIAGAPKSATSVSPEERKVVAIHEAGHALIGWLLEHTDALAKVTIIPRTKAALGFARTVPSDRHLHTQEQLFDFMCMALGGRAAEDLVLGRYTQGAQDDLRKVTDMAYAQVKYLGFSEKIGPISFQDNTYIKPFSDALSNTMDVEVRDVVKKAYARAKSVLAENRTTLDTLSSELFRRESLNYDDVEKLIGPPAYADKKQTPTVPFGPYASDIEKEGQENSDKDSEKR